MRIKISSFLFMYALLLSSPATLQPRDGHVSAAFRLFFLANEWFTESDYLKEKKELSEDHENIEAALGDGTMTEREAHAKREKQQKKLDEKMAVLKRARGLDTLAALLSEPWLSPDRNESALSAAALLLSGTITHQRVGAHRIKRLVLRLMDIALNFMLSQHRIHRPFEAYFKKRLVLRTLRALVRTAEAYLAKGALGKEAFFAHVLSLVRAFLNKDILRKSMPLKEQLESWEVIPQDLRDDLGVPHIDYISSERGMMSMNSGQVNSLDAEAFNDLLWQHVREQGFPDNERPRCTKCHKARPNTIVTYRRRNSDQEVESSYYQRSFEDESARRRNILRLCSGCAAYENLRSENAHLLAFSPFFYKQRQPDLARRDALIRAVIKLRRRGDTQQDRVADAALLKASQDTAVRDFCYPNQRRLEKIRKQLKAARSHEDAMNRLDRYFLREVRSNPENVILRARGIEVSDEQVQKLRRNNSSQAIKEQARLIVRAQMARTIRARLNRKLLEREYMPLVEGVIALGKNRENIGLIEASRESADQLNAQPTPSYNNDETYQIIHKMARHPQGEQPLRTILQFLSSHGDI